jgi:hypothetical protein
MTISPFSTKDLSMNLTSDNYKNSYLEEYTLEYIDFIEDNGYGITACLEIMLEFINKYTEKDFLLYYNEYTQQVEIISNSVGDLQTGFDIVDAFIACNGIELLHLCSNLFD